MVHLLSLCTPKGAVSAASPAASTNTSTAAPAPTTAAEEENKLNIDSTPAAAGIDTTPAAAGEGFTGKKGPEQKETCVTLARHLIATDAPEL
jgi:hypothetical protein